MYFWKYQGREVAFSTLEALAEYARAQVLAHLELMREPHQLAARRNKMPLEYWLAGHMGGLTLLATSLAVPRSAAVAAATPETYEQRVTRLLVTNGRYTFTSAWVPQHLLDSDQPVYGWSAEECPQTGIL